MVQDASSLPPPKTGDVRVKELPGGLYAAATYSGIATPDNSRKAERELRQAMIRKGIRAAGPEWVLARYNDPFTLPAFRRNEVLIPVADDFKLW
jgi:DNA gyrase inhibitor GyrI